MLRLLLIFTMGMVWGCGEEVRVQQYPEVNVPEPESIFDATTLHLQNYRIPQRVALRHPRYDVVIAPFALKMQQSGVIGITELEFSPQGCVRKPSLRFSLASDYGVTFMEPSLFYKIDHRYQNMLNVELSGIKGCTAVTAAFDVSFQER